MFATLRSEGFRASILALMFAAIVFSGARVEAVEAPQKNVYQSVFALPPSLPPGVDAAVVIFNTGNVGAQLRLQPIAAIAGEELETTMPAGGSRVVNTLDWLTPGRPMRLDSSSARVEVHLLLHDLQGQLVESFPIDRPAARRQDFVLPIAAGNAACPGATPADAAAHTTLYLVPASLRPVVPASYRLRALAGSGREVVSAVVGGAAAGAALGAAAGITLAEVFSPKDLAGTRTIRVESSQPFAGYGLAEVGPKDALGLLPASASRQWWIMQPPFDWDPARHVASLVLHNPQEVATKVRIGDNGSFVELAPGATATVAWPGFYTAVVAEQPISLYLGYGQNDGCGVTAQLACFDDRPWSRPRLLDRSDVLVAYGPRLPATP